jgi:hypothetical protein
MQNNAAFPTNVSVKSKDNIWDLPFAFGWTVVIAVLKCPLPSILPYRPTRHEILHNPSMTNEKPTLISAPIHMQLKREVCKKSSSPGIGEHKI